jgi:hypothetical protein
MVLNVFIECSLHVGIRIAHTIDMKLLAAAVLCSLPVMATSITYDLSTGGSVGVIFTAPDFLPNVKEPRVGTNRWYIEPNETSYFNCGQLSGLVSCDGTYFEPFNGGLDTHFSMRAYTDTYTFEVLDLVFEGADLLHTGSFLGSNGITRLNITAANDPVTMSPEPSTWVLGALGIVLVGMKRPRRLLHCAIDAEEVVSLSR